MPEFDPGTAFPLAGPFRVVVRDAENQRAELGGYIVLLGPAEEVTGALPESRARVVVPAGPAGGPRPRPAGGAPPAAATQPGVVNPAELPQRLEQLQERNQQLEAQIEVLKEVLVRQRNGAATRPAP